MKIDVHVHLTPPDIIADCKSIMEKEPYFKLLSESPQNKFVTSDMLVSHMNEVGITHSVVFGFSFNDTGLCKYVNDYVIEEVKKYPNLIGFAAVNPKDKGVTYEIERCYNEGLRGIGELFPQGQSIDLSSLHHTKDMADCCQKYNMPILIHTNEPIGHNYIGKTQTPLTEIASFINNFKDQPIILAHFGGGIFIYELMKEVKESFKNVYYDTAASLFLYDKSIYNTIKTIGILDKVLFGSDFPLVSPSRYDKLIKTSGLSEEEINQIYSLNVKRLFDKCGIELI